MSKAKPPTTPTASKPAFDGQLGMEVGVQTFGPVGEYCGVACVKIDQANGGQDLWAITVSEGRTEYVLLSLNSEGLKKVQDLIGAVLRAGVKAGVVE